MVMMWCIKTLLMWRTWCKQTTHCELLPPAVWRWKYYFLLWAAYLLGDGKKNYFYCEHLTCSLKVAVSEELPQGSTLATSAEMMLMLFQSWFGSCGSDQGKLSALQDSLLDIYDQNWEFVENGHLQYESRKTWLVSRVPPGPIEGGGQEGRDEGRWIHGLWNNSYRLRDFNDNWSHIAAG